MPADPETLTAIRAVADEITAKLDSKLDLHQSKSEETTRRIYDRIDEHARESRTMQDQYATETRVAVGALSTQVTQVTAELHAHTRHDDGEFSRLERALDEARDDRGKVWRAIAGLGASGALGATVAKWFESGGGA